jgi:hypothetical protein
MSHAIWVPSQSPNPQVKVIKGQAFLTMGHTIRPSADQVKKHIELKTELNAKGKGKDVPALKSNVELLPEEALYLLERGSLQIWQPGGGGDEELKMEFDEDTQTFPGCTEVTVMEGFARFVGMDGLSMERYQVSGPSPWLLRLLSRSRYSRKSVDRLKKGNAEPRSFWVDGRALGVCRSEKIRIYRAEGPAVLASSISKTTAY